MAPLTSPTILADLARKLGADPTALFVHAFVDLRPVHHLRIQTAIRILNAPAAMDAVRCVRFAQAADRRPAAGRSCRTDPRHAVQPGAPARDEAPHRLGAMVDLGCRTVRTLRCRGSSAQARVYFDSADRIPRTPRLRNHRPQQSSSRAAPCQNPIGVSGSGQLELWASNVGCHIRRIHSLPCSNANLWRDDLGQVPKAVLGARIRAVTTGRADSREGVMH